MCFFTAGTGNAGATIVAATFLLLVEPVLTFLQGDSYFRVSRTGVCCSLVAAQDLKDRLLGWKLAKSVKCE